MALEMEGRVLDLQASGSELSSTLSIAGTKETSNPTLTMTSNKATPAPTKPRLLIEPLLTKLSLSVFVSLPFSLKNKQKKKKRTFLLLGLFPHLNKIKHPVPYKSRLKCKCIKPRDSENIFIFPLTVRLA